MITQCGQRMMKQIPKETLIALYEAMARLGCGLGGLAYES